MTIVFVVLLTALAVTLAVVALAEFAPAKPRIVRQRLLELEEIASQHTATQRRKRQAKREQLEVWLQAFGEKVGKEGADWFQTRQKLLQAGYRNPNGVAIYYGTRVVTTIGFGGLVMLLAPVLDLQVSRLFMWILLGAGFGWLLPRAVLSRKVRARKRDLQKALADALDLMVVCVEAGLGLNQAMQRVSEEIEHISDAMAEELAIVNLEIRAGTPRDEALRNLGERTDVADLRSLTAMLIQTDRFGTSIAQALRVHSDTLRVKRRQRAEEEAAKTTIKLVLPLVLFIFPAMFVVILGPAVLNIIKVLTGI